MRHSTKIQQGKPVMWDTERFSFNATKYRARLDSNQVTVVYEQVFDDGTSKRWVHSFRGKTASEADKEADFHIHWTRKNTFVAEEIEAEEQRSRAELVSTSL